MNRYIDADEFNKDLQKRWNINSDHDFADKEVWRALEDAPSIDIVFCKDCRNFVGEGLYCNLDRYCKADDFCSYGEREGE